MVDKADAKDRMKADIVAAAQGWDTTISISDLTMRWLFSQHDPETLFAEDAAVGFLAASKNQQAEEGRNKFCQEYGLTALVSPNNGRWMFLRKYNPQEISVRNDYL